MNISTQGRWFTDEHGRKLMLRGVNLGGSSKVPFSPNGATWNRDGFYDHRNVSFIGRPFPLVEADEHFTRLKKWGLTFMRFLVTWEAIEHAGPGIYDNEYLDYIYTLARKAAEYDIYMYIDPHQDVWSRFSGGDGAPGWTFETLGMDITKFITTGAALTHQEYGDPYPRMIWPSNYSKFACATMFTLFFGGDVFAPRTKVRDVPVQEYLQSHYLNAIKQLAMRLRDLPNVIGYDTLNEPSQGYIGYPDANKIPAELSSQGASPTIYQSMLLAYGIPQEVIVKSIIPIPLSRKKTTTLNPQGDSLWMDGYTPIWKENGIWDLDQSGEPHLLLSNHFGKAGGYSVNFDRDHFVPFVERYISVLRQVHPSALIFVSPAPHEIHHGESAYAPNNNVGIVHSPHWYDVTTLYLQRYIPWLAIDTHSEKPGFLFGRKRRQENFIQGIKRLVDLSETMFDGVPTLIGEVGIPFNLNKKEAYRTGDFSKHVAAMDNTMRALESNLVNFTLWNYTADNDNQRGDQWNDEDLSIFCRDQQADSGDIHDGGRGLDAVIRPYAMKTPGTPLRISFNIITKIFKFEFKLDPIVDVPVEFYIPDYQYPHGYAVDAPDGLSEIHPEEQRLTYTPKRSVDTHRIMVTPRLSSE
jgi:hypothetical protein